MSNFIWVDREPHLADLVDHLSTKDIIAVDTESDSLYSYYEKVCLVQVSTDVEDYIIDPLAVDITPLAVIFADAGIQKIFHAAEYDIMTLRRDYGFQFNNLFDTMLAAR
ncbi:MAG: ribonuclease D, partial [Phycisphaerae bacterium]|nr:ribonuclease D [Phycisphaerae bacterium]NIV01008.1 ribonuclease D [Phycisphaerae bacterium]NIV70404.1 ribonuclease D [Phycisphaerae bacterium]NIX30958.1 ribonuclease D [Phycisphaerae bacterium]